MVGTFCTFLHEYEIRKAENKETHILHFGLRRPLLITKIMNKLDFEDKVKITASYRA
jgi:hypothetical protein